MSFLALVAALLIEQLRPLDPRSWTYAPLAALAAWAENQCNAGAYRHGVIAWWLVVAILLSVTAGIYFLLASWHPVLAWGANVLVLYLTMGFRQVSHFFSDIHLALREGRLDDARAVLAEWRGQPSDRLGSQDISGLAIERALVASHRQVFAVMLWFVVLPGPLGAVLYRASEQLALFWRRQDPADPFGQFAQRAFAWVDWLPQRVTAFGFAVVGDFEDAVYCWRTQAESWYESGAGIVLASGAGALGLRLGMPLVDEFEVVERPELGIGEDPGVDSLQGAVGLVWRALVFWLLILLALSAASWAG